MGFDFSTLLDGAVISAFAVPVTYTALGGAPAAVSMVLESGERIQAANPGALYLAFVRRADLTADPKPGDTVAYNSQNFRVAKVEPADSAGGIHLTLHYIRP